MHETAAALGGVLLGAPPLRENACRAEQERHSYCSAERGNCGPPPGGFRKTFPGPRGPGQNGFMPAGTIQILRQRLCGGIALLRTFVQAFETYGFKITTDTRLHRSGTRRLLIYHLAQSCHYVLGLERRPSCQKLEQNRPKTIDVGRGGDLAGPAR